MSDIQHTLHAFVDAGFAWAQCTACGRPDMARVHDTGVGRHRIDRVLPNGDTVRVLPGVPDDLFTAYELRVFFGQPENAGLLFKVSTT